LYVIYDRMYSPPTPKSPYSLEMYDDYQVSMMTKKCSIEFYIESFREFEEKYPFGSAERADIEDTIIKHCIKTVQDDCEYSLH
ncbi:chaperone protein DnaJ 49, partial [Tanacetum coccineum]